MRLVGGLFACLRGCVRLLVCLVECVSVCALGWLIVFDVVSLHGCLFNVFACALDCVFVCPLACVIV